MSTQTNGHAEPERLYLFDTTLRDGAQTLGVDFSSEDKRLIAERLDTLGIDYIEGGYPLSNPKDQSFFEQIREQPPAHASVCAFGMTRRKGIGPEDDTGMQAAERANRLVVEEGLSFREAYRRVAREQQGDGS